MNFSSDERAASKSARKRDFKRLQSMGAQLIALSAQQLARIPMSEALREALLQGQTISAHVAAKRHRQYVGKLLSREADVDAIAAHLASLHQARQADTARFKRIEHWRDRLAQQGPSALDAALQTFPGCDAAELQTLVEGVQRAPDQNRRRSAQRALFRYLAEHG